MTKTGSKLKDKMKERILKYQVPHISGKEVFAVQRAIGMHEPLSGVFDKEMRAKVRRYQKAHGMPPTGVLEAEDVEKLIGQE